MEIRQRTADLIENEFTFFFVHNVSFMDAIQ